MPQQTSYLFKEIFVFNTVSIPVKLLETSRHWTKNSNQGWVSCNSFFPKKEQFRGLSLYIKQKKTHSLINMQDKTDMTTMFAQVITSFKIRISELKSKYNILPLVLCFTYPLWSGNRGKF